MSGKQTEPTEFEKFRDFTKRVVSVPKAEIGRRFESSIYSPKY